MMRRTNCCATVVVGLFALWGTRGDAAEPYPFRTKPREVKKEVWLDVDFEQDLPQGAQLGTNAKVEAGRGAGNTKGLVSNAKGIIAKFPISKFDVGISRFELSLDHGGSGFSYFVARLNAYDKTATKIKSVTIGSGWGITPGARTWELKIANLEFENIFAVELELEQTSEGGVVQIDNIRLQRHDQAVISGRMARRMMTSALQGEGADVRDVRDVWIAGFDDRTSFFDFAPIDENKRYVRSEWQQRLHSGTTYKTTRGQLPTFVLGVLAKQSDLEAAASKQKKTLVQMYEYFLDDVEKHNFNTVWVDITKELEEFDKLAVKHGISVILRDPAWSNLETWVAKPDGPMPAEFKQTAAANFARYGKLKSLIAYHMNRPLGAGHQPMLAAARQYLTSLNPKIQLICEETDVYRGKTYEEPYPHLGIQSVNFNHYAGRPWIEPSYLYHPTYWPIGIGEGHHRRIFDEFRVKMMPCLWALPCGRQFGKKSIDMQQDRVNLEATGWVQDGETKRWSGWYRYKYPANLLRAIVWKAVESGTGGVLFHEWGPASISAEVTGTDILNEDKYANGNYQPDFLRLADMSESDGWEELGAVAQELVVYRNLLAVTTLHGENAARTNNGHVRVRTLTGRDNPFRVLAVVNLKIGDYDHEELKIDPATGELTGYAPADPTTFELTVEKDYGLVDILTGKTLSPKTTTAEDRAAVYELEHAPGEGRFYFRGKPTTFQRFIKEYRIPVTGKDRATPKLGR